MGGDGGEEEERGVRVHEGHVKVLRCLNGGEFRSGDVNAVAFDERPQAELACDDQFSVEAAGDEQRGGSPWLFLDKSFLA